MSATLDQNDPLRSPTPGPDAVGQDVPSEAAAEGASSSRGAGDDVASPSPMSVAGAGMLLGAGVGAVTALGDFGAMWLWLQLWGDRVGFLARLMAVQVSLGALLGAFAGALAGALEPVLRQRAALSARPERALARLRPVSGTVLLAPAAFGVGHMLFTGGKMSMMPYRGVFAALLGVLLTAGVYVALRVILWAAQAPWSSRVRATLGVGCLVVVGILGKLDQTFLPNLYDYLHGCLTAVQAAFAGLGLWLLYPVAQARATRLRPPRTKGRLLGTAAALLAALCTTLFTLNVNQNVRVALVDARASNSRSVMQGLEPLLALTRHDASAEAIASARARRAARGEAARAQQTDGGAPPPAMAEAHVLLITVDALRADHLGAYGYTRGISPELDQLAAQSVVFDRAYASAPHSSYSLCSLMTSEHLHQTTRLEIPLPEATLASTLAESGYSTTGIYTLGIFHTEGESLRLYEHNSLGFARHEHANLDAERRTDLALTEIDRLVSEGEPPTLLWTHYFDVHEPYQDTRYGTSDVDRYDGEIAHVDTEIGRLLREARARLTRPLVVILTADHGEEFRDHGGVYHGSTLYEEQIRVPLMIMAPGYEPGRVAAPVELVDVAPTILGLLDVLPAASMHGEDLRALMRGDVADVGPAFAAVSRSRMVVDWPYKLVADLRFNTFALYNLETDPEERVNLANAEPERIEELRGEIYAFIDALQQSATSAPLTAHEQALAWGRMNDRRAVEPLGELLADADAPQEQRCEAAQMLGRLADDRSKPTLMDALSDPDPLVAAEAAISLGRLYDPRARDALRRLVHVEDADLRSRAAVSLARLRDPDAVPGLLDTLRLTTDTYEREESVRWLGRLQNPIALEPLIELLTEFRFRYLSIVALGQLGDRRAYDHLVDVLEWESRSNVRDGVARSLGQLGDPRALPLLLRMAGHEVELTSAPESLVRLNALSSGLIGGVDLNRTTGRRNRTVAECREEAVLRDWDYLDRTTCSSRANELSARLALPPSVRAPSETAEGAAAPGEASQVVLIVRLRRVGEGAPFPVTVTLEAPRGAPALPELSGEAASGWRELRMELPRSALTGSATRATVHVPEGERIEVDHILLVPVLPAPRTAP
ncbi:MAG: sulfatase-like hydrolase/transferase [Myxococcales bacterium]|nr:sulfatase-like hydrolase/transferase [Myxococcales bacterium]